MKTVLLLLFVLFLSCQVFSAPITKSTDVFCGLSDESVSEYFKGTNKWSKNSLTWSIRSFPLAKQFSESRTKEIITEAFQTWTHFIPITIKEVCYDCEADIIIEFGRRDHGKCPSFDGPGGSLAHAAYPEIGYIHFDLDEPWSESYHKSDNNLFLVAVHEIGHALGLRHSDNSASIMYPHYPPASRSKELPSLDIDSIQHLYGAKKEKTLLYQLIHNESNKALDVSKSESHHRNNVQIFTSHGKENQQWAIYPNRDGTVKLINPQSGKALDVSANGHSDGTNVQIYTENGSDAQKWILTHIEKGIYKLIHKSSGKVLDVLGNSLNDEANVQIWPSNDTTAQKWRLVPINLS